MWRLQLEITDGCRQEQIHYGDEFEWNTDHCELDKAGGIVMQSLRSGKIKWSQVLWNLTSWVHSSYILKGLRRAEQNETIHILKGRGERRQPLLKSGCMRRRSVIFQQRTTCNDKEYPTCLISLPAHWQTSYIWFISTLEGGPIPIRQWPNSFAFFLPTRSCYNSNLFHLKGKEIGIESLAKCNVNPAWNVTLLA